MFNTNYESCIQDLQQAPLMGSRITSFDLIPKKSISIHFFVTTAEDISDNGQEFLVFFTGIKSVVIGELDLDSYVENVISVYQKEEDVLTCTIIHSRGRINIMAKECHVIRVWNSQAR